METNLKKFTEKRDYSQLQEAYNKKRSEIEKRLQDFKAVFSKSDYEVFTELCFCLMTPQTKAKSAAHAIEKLKENDLIRKGTQHEIKNWMASIRFNENKSGYIVKAREMLTENGEIKIKDKLQGDKKEVRQWLVDNIKGYGLKEASHFLRNIGFGDDIAILDRHILKNLVKNGIIDKVPKVLTDKRYLEIEDRMRLFSKELNIPMDHLDLVWWSEETGEIFK